MSSIYRKGRDGYFYYQTYVLNKKTGKKNKRIYHSLGTKVRAEAQEKKNRLDHVYIEKEKRALFWEFYKNKGRIISFLCLAVIIPLISNYFFFSSKIKDFNPDIVEDINNLNFPNSKLEEIDSSNKLKKLKIEALKGQTKNIETNVTQEQNIDITTYTIERIKESNNSFDQGEIYVSIRGDYDPKPLQNLCEKIRSQHKQFLNIIICLYRDSYKCKKIANGSNDINYKDDLNECWLAMYTYNTVEKAYFNDNPTGYLGKRDESKN
jgi:hypothetical protein